MARSPPALYCFGMRGDEKRVVDAFVAWLQENGWTADTEVNFVDVCARRGDERLYAEAKGRTEAIGLDVDTLYGQLLRGWPIPAPAPATRSWSPRSASPQPSAFRPGFANG